MKVDDLYKCCGAEAVVERPQICSYENIEVERELLLCFKYWKHRSMDHSLVLINNLNLFASSTEVPWNERYCVAENNN